MKDAYYFSHDSNARNDPKLVSAISVYGVQAYAWFFMIIEILRDQTGYKLSINKYIWNTLAMQLYSDASTIERFVHDCCNEFIDDNGSLLSIDDKNLWSNSLFRRMKSVDEVRDKRREAAQIRWSKKSNANGMHLHMQEHSKTDAIKEKKSKENNNKYSVMLSEFTNDESLIKTFYDFFEMRNKIKRPVTERALSNLLSKLMNLSPDVKIQIAILEQSILNCWQDIFPLKVLPMDKQKDHYRRAE